MPARRVIGRLVLAATSTLVALAAVDVWMRTRVGACGPTPFRTSSLEALPHELAPGRETTYKGVRVRVNAAGFRGPELVDPAAGVERIALVGDSVTFGNGCPEEETLSVALERELAGRGRPSQVVNCGIPGFNAANVATLARERVLPLRPRRLIWVMIANDVSKSAPRSVIPPDAVIDACADFPLGSPLLQWLGVQGSGLLRALGVEHDGYVEQVLAAAQKGGNERVAGCLAELRDACGSAGVGFSVAIYPYLVRADRDPFRPIEAECARRCAELAIPCVDLRDAFAPDEELTRYWVTFLDGHPDGMANRRVAPLIMDRLLTP